MALFLSFRHPKKDRFESVTFSLYVNGFAFSTLDGREALRLNFGRR